MVPHGTSDAPHGAGRRYLMDEESVTTGAEESKDVQTDGTDYEALYRQAMANARRWETRAKANSDKAKRLDELAGQSESVEDRIAALEAENAAMREAAERRALVAKVASATGLAETLVGSLNGTDEKALLEQASAIAELMPSGAPHAPEAGTFPRDEGPASTDWLREAIENH